MTLKPARRKRTKLSDVIVEDVKRSIVTEQMKPGDRLPNEKDLIDLYQCSKGTVREALKALEVEGLVCTRTGPGGGAYLVEASVEPASRALRNFLHFRHLDGAQVYQLRKVIEVELAVTAMTSLTTAQLQALEDNIAFCAKIPTSEGEQRDQRIAELEFHNILADACSNPLLAFMGRFLNDLLRDLVVLKKAYVPERHQFGDANVAYHRQLMEAFRRQDAGAVCSLMAEHMQDAESHMVALEGEVAQKFLLDFPHD